MSNFIQVNLGGSSKGTQIFTSKDRGRFVQYGGGIQIIDGVPTRTNFPVPSSSSPPSTSPSVSPRDAIAAVRSTEEGDSTVVVTSNNNQ